MKTRLLFLLFFLIVSLGLPGCAENKGAQRDSFFENWRIMAEKSKGHSPTRSSKAVALPDDQKRSETPPDEMQKEETAVLRRPLPVEKVSLRMHESNVVSVLRALARAANQNLLISSNVEGHISLNVQEMPWDQVFTGILRTLGLAYTWEGDILRVMSLKDMEHDLKMDAVQEKRKAQKLVNQRVEPLITTVVSVDYVDPRKLKESLTQFLTKDEAGKPRGSVMVDEHTNSLIIQTTRDDIVKMIPLIEKLDRPTPQVLIKANIVETTQELARELGVQWGGMYSTYTRGENKVYVTPGGTGGKAVPGTAEAGQYTPFYGEQGISGQGFASNFPVSEKLMAELGVAGSLGLMFGKVGSKILEMQLSALQSDGKLNILSSPSITTLDNQTAFTENGERVPYVSTDKEGNRQVNFEDAVLRLEITPHVIDGENLKMSILVKKDEVDSSRNVDGNPLIIKKQTKTTLIAQDGETIVISGLTKQRTAESERGVPWMKDIPLFGYLFKTEGKGNKMEEVLIFITPQILEQQPEARRIGSRGSGSSSDPKVGKN